MTVEFELDGQTLTALNGGPVFKFNEGLSLVVHCRSQDEVDHYRDHLSADGDGKCGWLKNRFGVSWRVVPQHPNELMTGPDPEKVRRVTAALMQMKKIDVKALQQAAG